jgi:uncharacterized membrane protein YdjX (TVP38/TMEM64 family)
VETTLENTRRAGLKRRLLRALPLAAVAIGLIAVLASGVWRHLSLAELAARRSALKSFVLVHPAESLALYVLAYCAVVAFSIPGALLMTLTGGFLFGTWVGGAAATVGVSAGAVIMFLAAHTVLGDLLRRYARADGLIRRIEDGVRRNAFSYLLFLRLMPAAPIWLVNIAAAFVRTPLWIYATATFLGIAPSTFIYAGIGASLDGVFARGGAPDFRAIFHVRVFAALAALALLALVPVAVQAWRRRSAQRRAGALPKPSA